MSRGVLAVKAYIIHKEMLSPFAADYENSRQL